mgnify:CR=1 FL=1
MPDPTSKLEAERSALLQKLAATGDMRRGSITECYRCCGKASCACVATDHPGHGPYYAFTTKVDGKTKTLQLRPGPLLTKMEREVETYRSFRATCDRLFDVNEVICDARPVEAAGQEKKRRLAQSSRPRSSGPIRRSPVSWPGPAPCRPQRTGS